VTQKIFADVVRLADLRDSYVTLFKVAGRPVILTRMGDTVRAFDGICTHSEFQFATSRLVGGCDVECPMHGACFDAETGEVTHGPADTPLKPIEIVIADGVVRLCVDWANTSEEV
jgi:nitrite reductase/ring-hydroxylating ferredoxin subunit